MTSEDRDTTTNRRNPIQDMNRKINERNRETIHNSYTMTHTEKKIMNRVLESAAKFKPYKQKK